MQNIWWLGGFYIPMQIPNLIRRRSLNMENFEWDLNSIGMLDKLWKQTKPQLSTAEIGRRIGCSKNAVCGKAHRLGLPARPRIIQNHPLYKDTASGKTRAAERIGIVPSRGLCSWPVGDPHKPDFHFCGKEAMEGKPYCWEHAKVAYYKPKHGIKPL
jgi:GcrA cell cycle regulator